jgi:hypothetical protein
VSFSDERDHAEEQANGAEMMEQDHCMRGYDPDTERATSCTDDDNSGDCVACECCCTPLAVEYGPRDGMLLTAEQRAPIAAWQPTDGEVAREAAEADQEPDEPDFADVAPNAGSAS